MHNPKQIAAAFVGERGNAVGSTYGNETRLLISEPGGNPRIRETLEGDFGSPPSSGGVVSEEGRRWLEENAEAIKSMNEMGLKRTVSHSLNIANSDGEIRPLSGRGRLSSRRSRRIS